MAPVEVPAMVTVPEPLASIVRFSLLPLETTETARPAAAAALLTFRPVAALAVEASTCKLGLVVPAAPTARALALVDVPVIAPLTELVVLTCLMLPLASKQVMENGIGVALPPDPVTS